MAPSSPAALPSVPPSVAEWEDLLVRMEIMQRALRNALETVSPGDAGAAEILGGMLEREVRVREWLERVSGVGPSGAAPAPTAGGTTDLRSLADRFVSQRARNFAMLQRRGLEVWRWTADFGDHGEVSAYQVITWLVVQDVRALAALRERSVDGGDVC